MDRLEILEALAGGLKGVPPGQARWTAVVELANQSLVTPQLAAALGPHYGDAPANVARFLGEVLERNRERNRRLWRQLNDATAALNAAGITPVLLKGAARWVALGREQPFDRVLSDLDLLVEPGQAARAIQALTEAGFTAGRCYEGPAVHVVAELGREQDPGFIDLHQRPPGPPGLADTAELRARRRTVRLEGGTVQVPDEAAQILYLVLHDQFHDGDYWRGGFDLRHLSDLAALAPALGREDWRWLRRACGTSLARSALHAQLYAAEQLIGGTRTRGAGLHARWTCWRWMIQYARPRLRVPLAVLAAAVDGPQLLAHRAADRRRRGQVLGEAHARSRAAPKARLERLRKILQVESGKV